MLINPVQIQELSARSADRVSFMQPTSKQMMPHPGFIVLCVHVQDRCSLMQLQTCMIEKGANIRFEKCVGHKGTMKLKTFATHGIQAHKCTNCSGCTECNLPVSLTIPDGIGGSGCTAEVAAQAEALRQSAACKASASRSSAAGTQQQTGSAGAGGGASSQATGAGAEASETAGSSNPVLVECGVCHRKPGDPGVPATLKLCGGCQQVRYCSVECQRKDWKLGHKALCELLRKLSETSRGVSY
jgi:hypothetical protein